MFSLLNWKKLVKQKRVKTPSIVAHALSSQILLKLACIVLFGQ
jgi:hypothetical protein